MRKKTIIGKVWTGFVGEYKKSPVYIIKEPYGAEAETVFLADLLRPFWAKKVRITIEEIKVK